MTDLISWIGDFLTLSLGTVGTTEITLGLVVAFGLVASVAIGTIKRMKGKG